MEFITSFNLRKPIVFNILICGAAVKNENWFIFMIFGKSKKFTMFSTIDVQFFTNTLFRCLLNAASWPHNANYALRNARFEQFLTLESIENFWQYLNLRPRTNPIKAMTKSPLDESHKVKRYLVRLRHLEPDGNSRHIFTFLDQVTVAESYQDSI